MKHIVPNASGYAAPTEKATRAVADGRERRVHTALSKVGARPAWVTTEFHAGDFASQSPRSLSPSALVNRQRAGRCPVGLHAKVQEQLADERSRLGARLQQLAASCHQAAALHSMPPEQYQQQQQQQLQGKQQQQLDSSKQVMASSFPSLSDATRTTSPAAANTASASAPPTQRRPATPPTAVRPHQWPLAPQPQPSPAHTPTQGQQRSHGQQGGQRLEEPQGPQQQPQQHASNRVGARRKLTYDNGAVPTATAAAVPSTPYAPGSSSHSHSGSSSRAAPPVRDAPWAQQRPRTSAPMSTPTTARSRTSPAAAAAFSTATSSSSSAPSTATASTPLGSGGRAFAIPTAASGAPTRAAAAGGSSATAAAVGAADAAAGAAEGVSEPRRVAWAEPVQLLAATPLNRFTGARMSQGPQPQELYESYGDDDTHAASHISHRERLRAGIAELHAELHSSWQALLAAGAI